MLTRHDPPPRRSFHQRVFKRWSLPSSCNLSTAPLINVRYGDPCGIAIPYPTCMHITTTTNDENGTKGRDNKFHKAIKFRSLIIAQGLELNFNLFSLYFTFWVEHAANLSQFAISLGRVLNRCRFHKVGITAFALLDALNTLGIWCGEDGGSLWVHEGPHFLICREIWVLFLKAK